jgi:hypothetical protein
MNEIITTLVADEVARHCMHCPALWDCSCAVPCVKVDVTFPTVLKADYIAEWARITTTVLEVYAAKKRVGGKTV